MTDSAYDIADGLLREATNESGYRAAASRAYLAAFQHVLSHPNLSGFSRNKTGDDHQRLINYLIASSDINMRRMGLSYLKRLRTLRNHADYELGVPFTFGLAKEALERAAEIIFEFLP